MTIERPACHLVMQLDEVIDSGSAQLWGMSHSVGRFDSSIAVTNTVQAVRSPMRHDGKACPGALVVLFQSRAFTSIQSSYVGGA